MKRFFLVFVFCFTTLVIYGNKEVKADDFTDAMLDAKANLVTAMNKMDKSEVVKTRNQFERILQLKKDEWLVNYYIGLCDYMIGVSEMSAGTPDESVMESLKKYNESGLDVIEGVIQNKSDFADAYILKIFLNFTRWTYEQEKMNDIIDVYMSTDAKAKQYGENNPRYSLVKGINAYWTPEAFGGGVDNAIEFLDRSDELFNNTKPENELYPEWGHDWAIGYKVLSLIKRDDEGDRDKAQLILNDGMTKYPNSGFLSYYVKSELDKPKK